MLIAQCQWHLSTENTLRFMWGDKLFQYTCLPSGLSSAPKHFTKLLKPVYGTLLGQGHLNIGYIDDSYLQDSSVSDCGQNIWAKLLLASWRGSTKNQYDVYIKNGPSFVLKGKLINFSHLLKMYLISWQNCMKKALPTVPLTPHAVHCPLLFSWMMDLV